MKLHLELIRYGNEKGANAGRLALLIRADARHVDIMADDDENFDLDTVSAAIDALRRRAQIVAHIFGEGNSG